MEKIIDLEESKLSEFRARLKKFFCEEVKNAEEKPLKNEDFGFDSSDWVALNEVLSFGKAGKGNLIDLIHVMSKVGTNFPKLENTANDFRSELTEMFMNTSFGKEK